MIPHHDNEDPEFVFFKKKERNFWTIATPLIIIELIMILILWCLEPEKECEHPRIKHIWEEGYIDSNKEPVIINCEEL